MSYFEHIAEIRYEGPQSDNPLAYRHYDKSRQVLGKSLEEHLRIAVCYGHTFIRPGVDSFGHGTFTRPWQRTGDVMERALQKADAAFEFFSKLGAPFYTFHDTDVAPECTNLRDYSENLRSVTDYLARKQQDTGIKLLWGTANLFSHPRYAAGAATSPDPEIFAYAVTQACQALDATQQLGGANYMLWGGREDYGTLLKADLVRERNQLARFLRGVVEHAHKIGFKGSLLIEPKPQEPTRHQYDYDVASVHEFLLQYGLEKTIRVNIEANHATLAGHSFHREMATAYALGIFGSAGANWGDPQNGCDTDQFPNSVEELTLAFYEILRHGGFTTGGMNFDSKVRRQSVDPEDLFHGHVGAIDNLALAVERAAVLIENERLDQFKRQRYAGWESKFGRKITAGDYSLSTLAAEALARGINPQQFSGQQERMENIVNQAIYSGRQKAPGVCNKRRSTTRRGAVNLAA